MSFTKYQITPWTSSLNVEQQNQQEAQSTRHLPFMKKNKNLQVNSQMAILRSIDCQKDKKFNLKPRNSSQFSNKTIFHNDYQSNARSSRNLGSNLTQLHIHDQTYQLALTPKLKSNSRCQSMKNQFNIYKNSFRKERHACYIQDQQKLTLFYSLCEKNQIKLQISERTDPNPEKEEIFKRIDQISKKRKKQLNLPKIAVLYAPRKL